MPSNIHPLHPTVMLTLEQVRKLVPLSHSQVYRLMRAGRFPQSFNVGGRRVAWRQKDVFEWLAECQPSLRSG